METEVRNPMTLISFTSGVSHSILLSLYWMVYKSMYPPGNCQETSTEVLVMFVIVGAVARGRGAPVVCVCVCVCVFQSGTPSFTGNKSNKSFIVKYNSVRNTV